MKSKISKLMGVALTVALLASLMAMAAPVSARTLGWSTETIPSAANDVIETGVSVVDIAVAADGNIIYAGGGSTILYRSTNRGVAWADIDFGGATGNDTDLVAVAPDDSDYVAVADTTTEAIWITTNGGTTWGSVGIPGAAASDPITTINDISISAASSGIHYLAVAGIDTGAAAVWKYNIGAAAPAWVKLSALTGYTADTVAANSAAIALAN